MIRIQVGAILLAAIALAQVPASSARAAEPQWNQKEVLALAEQLVRVLDETTAAAREAPPQATILQQRTRDDAASGLRQVREAASDYVSKLEKGWDRDMTESYLRNVKKMFKDSRKRARDAVPTEQVEQKLRETDAVLDQLSRYYPSA